MNIRPRGIRSRSISFVAEVLWRRALVARPLGQPCPPMRPPGSGIAGGVLQPLVRCRSQLRIEEVLCFDVTRRRADEALNMSGRAEHKLPPTTEVLRDLVNPPPRHDVIRRARDEIFVSRNF